MVYEMDDGVVVVTASQSGELDNRLDGFVQEAAGKKRIITVRTGTERKNVHIRRPYEKKDFLPPIHNLRQMISYDWYKLWRGDSQSTPAFLNLNYIAFEAVSLSATSKAVLKQMIQ